MNRSTHAHARARAHTYLGKRYVRGMDADAHAHVEARAHDDQTCPGTARVLAGTCKQL